MTIWARQDEAAAMREGWYISNSSEGCDEIQRHPWSEIFPSDAEAIAHVYWKAGTGSDLHRRAIAYTLRDGNSWAYERPLRKHKATAEEDEITDIELLPLPELASERVFGAKWDDFDIQDYARANVAHHTAKLQAEIEALRAEVALLRHGNVAYAQQVAGLIGRAGNAEARAERRAEALRHLRNHTSVNSHQIELIDAALAGQQGRDNNG